MPEKKIVEMPAEVTVIVDKVSEVTQSKGYGYESSSETWLPVKVDGEGRIEITQQSPLYLRNLNYGADADGYIKYIRTDSSGRTEITQTDSSLLKSEVSQTDPTLLRGMASGVDSDGYVRYILVDSSGRPAVKIDSDSIGLAKDSTLSSIDSKITKCDTDNTTVSKRVSDSFSHGQVDVGTSAVQLTSSSTPCKFGVVIKADDDNSGNVYIGGSGVTTSNGFRLKAGQGISFEIDDASKVYAIADSTGQKVHWIAV